MCVLGNMGRAVFHKGWEAGRVSLGNFYFCAGNGITIDYQWVCRKFCFQKLRKNFSPAYRQAGFCAPEKFNKIAICVALPHFLKNQYKLAPNAERNKRNICDSAISVVW